MRNLHFKYAKAENFICFGPEPIELKFETLGNIVLVRGRILDRQQDSEEDDDKASCNGVGKSSIPEILTYALYGKTIKKPKKIGHKDVINNKCTGKLRVEVQWDDYRVVRTRVLGKTGKDSGTIQFWESSEGIWNDDTEKTLGGMPATQKLIEEKIGLSYEAFVNVVIFTDDSNAAFLECDTGEKRQIVENLLSLEKYRDYGETAKRLLKESNNSVKVLAKEYELLLASKDTTERRVGQIRSQEKQWKDNRLAEIKGLFDQAKAKKVQLESTDEGSALLQYQEAQDKIKVLSEEITEYEGKAQVASDHLKKTHAALNLLRDGRNAKAIELQTAKLAIAAQEKEIAAKERAVRELQGKQGTCPWCYGQVDPANFAHVIEHAQQAQEEARQAIVGFKDEMAGFNESIAKYDEKIERCHAVISDAETKAQRIQTKLRENRNQIHAFSQVREPKANSAQLLLEQQIADLRKQAADKNAELEGPSPYAEILKSSLDDIDKATAACVAKDAQIKEEEASQPYYTYWLKAFGDDGIRKFVIDGIIPALNARIEYWLQFLIDNKIELVFNNQLDENIQRNPPDGNPFVYHMLSKGQRQRLNLAVSQAFAYVMMLNSGTSPSVVFLDEVTTNVDPQGVQGVYNMICELAKDKQVFVTTHDHDLLGMLHGCQTINLEMRNGITTLAK
jgi:DNA repair exonuclease SbcCD ATPase subunit